MTRRKPDLKLLAMLEKAADLETRRNRHYRQMRRAFRALERDEQALARLTKRIRQRELEQLPQKEAGPGRRSTSGAWPAPRSATTTSSTADIGAKSSLSALKDWLPGGTG